MKCDCYCSRIDSCPCTDQNPWIESVFCGGDKDIWCVELSDGGDDCWQMVAIRLICEEWFPFEWFLLCQGQIPCWFLNDSVDLVVVQQYFQVTDTMVETIVWLGVDQ